ncbi:Hint domain-containing protein [Dysgonomonas reticulitermitis]
MKTNVLLLMLACLFAFNLSINAQSRIAIGTWVVMADDTRKNVDNIAVGDVVLSYDYTKKVYEKKKVTSIDKVMYSRMVRLVLENKRQILASSDLPFWGEEGWVSTNPELSAENPLYKDIKEAKTGNYLYYYDILSTSSDRIAFVEGIMEPMMAYTIQIEGGGAIIANSFIIGTN